MRWSASQEYLDRSGEKIVSKITSSECAAGCDSSRPDRARCNEITHKKEIEKIRSQQDKSEKVRLSTCTSTYTSHECCRDLYFRVGTSTCDPLSTPLAVMTSAFDASGSPRYSAPSRRPVRAWPGDQGQVTESVTAPTGTAWLLQIVGIDFAQLYKFWLYQ